MHSFFIPIINTKKRNQINDCVFIYVKSNKILSQAEHK